MPIFPNQYPEKTNPTNADKLLLADTASGNAIKSVQIDKVIGLVPAPDPLTFGITATKPADLSKVKGIFWKGTVGDFQVSISGTHVECTRQNFNYTASDPNVISLADLFTFFGVSVVNYRNNLTDASNASMLMTVKPQPFYSNSPNQSFGAVYVNVSETDLNLFHVAGAAINNGSLTLTWSYSSLETLASKSLPGATYIWRD